MLRFVRRTNSAKLGRPVIENLYDHSKHRTIYFDSSKQSITSPRNQTNPLTKSVDKYHNVMKNNPKHTHLTSLSRINREYYGINAIMNQRMHH